MSKYYDLEKIEAYLEKIASIIEKYAKIEEPQEEAKEEEVEELAKEEAKEPHEALKEPKQEELVKEEEAEKVEIVKAEPAKIDPELVKEALEKPKEEFAKLAKMRDFAHKEAEAKLKAPVKRGDSRHEIRKHRISPYRIKEQGKKAPSSGFRIKED